jgi:hypothetical protein
MSAASGSYPLNSSDPICSDRSPAETTSRFCCENPDCALYAERNAGNLSVCARYGKLNPIRLLYCNACKYRFSERKGMALFHCHLPAEKALAVFQHLDEGCGIRPTGRLVGGLGPALMATTARPDSISRPHRSQRMTGVVIGHPPSGAAGAIRRNCRNCGVPERERTTL